MKVLIADDHDVVRDGLRSLIQSRKDWAVCGEASNGREAVELCERLKPDVAVLDLMMPDLNGIDATRQIKRYCPETEVLIFTGQVTDGMIHQAFEAGARSYIAKTDAQKHLLRALEALAEHRPYFTSHVGDVFLARMTDGKRASEADSDTEARISDREREIVQLVAEGKSNKEVAALLGISVKTAETHRSNLMEKLGISSVSELVRYAIRQKIIEP